MSNIETEGPQRVPRKYDAIEQGALSLGLSERVRLSKKLTESIEKELEDKRKELEEAENIVKNGA